MLAEYHASSIGQKTRARRAAPNIDPAGCAVPRGGIAKGAIHFNLWLINLH